MGADPFLAISAENSPSLQALRQPLNSYRIMGVKNNIPFLGGAVGFMSYDPGLGVPEWFFAFYNSAVIIDHLKKKLHIFSCGFPEKKLRLQRLLAEENFKKMEGMLSTRKGTLSYRTQADYLESVPYLPRGLKSSFTRQKYIAAVKRAKEHIRKGDIYQVNLSQQFSAKTRLAAPEIYRRLRSLSPAYYNAYFDAGDFQILSSSPEMFLSLHKNKVTTRPMKGTRPRGESRPKDLRLKNELLRSAKDKAELMMITDLERNDLGKVCAYESIKVDKLRELEKYNTVFQTTATISGRLHKDNDRIDLLSACFPGGSITGCPKIRAMEVIKELEPQKRSIYTGALGYLSFTEDMEFNILIRTILKKDGKIYFGSGGGIVADSDPQAEYEETLIKAKAMIEAING